MADSKLFILTPVDGVNVPSQLPSKPSWPSPDDPLVPAYPDNGLPSGGNVGTPENPIVIPEPPQSPTVPGTPPSVWPGVPIHPETPTHPIALPPGMVYPPLPDGAGRDKAVILVFIPTVGYRWIVVDLGLDISNLPAAGAQPKPAAKTAAKP